LNPKQLEESDIERLISTFDPTSLNLEDDNDVDHLKCALHLVSSALKSRDTDLNEAIDHLNDKEVDKEVKDENKKLKKELKEMKCSIKKDEKVTQKDSRGRHKNIEDKKERKVTKTKLWKELQSEVEKLKQAASRHLSSRCKMKSSRNSKKIDDCHKDEGYCDKEKDCNSVTKSESNKLFFSKHSLGSSTELVLHLSFPSQSSGIMLGLALGMGTGLGLLAGRLVSYLSSNRRITYAKYANPTSWNPLPNSRISHYSNNGRH